MLPSLLVFALAVAPPFVSAALFPSNTQVKLIDAKGFRAAMKENRTSMVAFVAPWCGHCQRMAPEYSRAALGLYPLVPLYAVDCDDAKNKKLCADQGVTGFPTVKLFPRGKEMKPMLFEGPERTASAFFYWASRNIPSKVTKLTPFEKIPGWASSGLSKPRALLMDKSNKIPLLWHVLANKYRDQIDFARFRDRKGKGSVKLGFPAGADGQAKVLIYPVGSDAPLMFEGIMKYDSLSKFFDSLIDGTVDLNEALRAAAQEEFIPDPEEVKIQQQQEAEMLKLAHGGYAELVDFEQAVKDGSAKNFHAMNGYPGMMGSAEGHAHAHAAGGSEGALKESSKDQGETPKSPKKGSKMPMTDEAGQIVFEASTETGQPRTPVAEPTPVAVEEPEAEAEPAVEDTVVVEPSDEATEEAAAQDADAQPAVEPEPVVEERIKDEL